MSKHALWCLRFLVYLAVFNMTLGELCAQVPPPAAPAEPPAPRGEKGSLEIPLLKAYLSATLDARKQPADPTNHFPATAAWVHLLVQLKQESPDGMVMITMYRAGKVEDKRIVEAKSGTRFVVSFYPLRADTFPVGEWWVTFKAGGEVLGSIPFTVGEPQPATPAAPAAPVTPTAPTTAPATAPSANDQPPEPGPPPTGLGPMPPLVPKPPAAARPPSPLPPVPAGEKLAEATIGPMGGTVEAPGKLALTFPAGALAAEEQITITTGRAAEGVHLYDVTRTGQGFMREPVKVQFSIPEGVKSSDVLPLHEAEPSIYFSPPCTCDEAARVLAMEVNHFSAIGWTIAAVVLAVVGGAGYLDRPVNWLTAPLLPYLTAETLQNVAFTGVGVGVGSVVGYGAAKLLGFAVASVPGGICVFGGMAAVYFTYKACSDIAMVRDLAGPYPAGRFSLYWPAGLYANQPGIWFALDPKQRQFLACIGPDAFTADQKNAGREANGEGPIKFAGIQKTYCFSELQFLRVPLVMLVMAWELGYADNWYGQTGTLPAPTPIDVYFRNMTNLGEMYKGNLHVRAGDLAIGAKFPEGWFTATATIAHEFWHALCAQNGWKERRFVGAEDAVCTAMESMVFPFAPAFLKEQPWPQVYPALRNGLLNEGPREANTNAARRGYRLWPWTLYLGRLEGPKALQDWMREAGADGLIARHFRDFCFSVIADDRALPDPLTIKDQSGFSFPVRTGWGESDRGAAHMADDTMACPANEATPAFPLGWCDFPPSPPLSLRTALFEVPRPTPSDPNTPVASEGTIVIRRQSPEPTEDFVALRPVRIKEVQGVGRMPLSLTTKDMVEMKGGVAVHGSWVDSPEFKPYMGVSVICTATTPEAAPQAGNRLLSYRLNPPSEVRFDKEPGKPGVVLWEAPTLGGTLAPSDCLSGYRVYGETASGHQKLIAELELPGGLGLATSAYGVPVFQIGPTAAAQELPENLVADCVRVGLQSVDRALKYPDGGDVRSDIGWSPAVAMVTVSPSPFEAKVADVLEFTAKADYVPPGARYKWQTRGDLASDGKATTEVQFWAEGRHTVTVTLFDADGRRLGSATATGQVKKKEEPQPTTGIWRLVRRSVWPEATGPNDHHKLDIGATKADCRNMHLGENRIIYQCLHSWTALPTTLTPGKELAITLTAQSVVWPGDEGGNRTSTFVNWDRVEDGVVSPMGTNELAAKECRITLPKEGEGGLSICIKGEGGWMHWSVTYVYEWVPAKP